MASAAFLVPVFAGALGIQVIVNGETITFADVPQSAWYASFIHDAAEAGIVNGYMDTSGHSTGKFGPENSVTIAEALKIAIESSGYDAQAYSSLIDSGVRHWSASYVSVAKAENFAITNISVGLDRRAKRFEVASMLASAFQLENRSSVAGTTFHDVSISTPYGSSIETLARDGVVSGDTDAQGLGTGMFRPQDVINRAEVVKMAMAARVKYGQPGNGRTPSENAEQMGTMLVTYRDDGFTPSVLHVKSGTTVTFRNDSSSKLWVASNPHPLHTDDAAFDSKTGLLTGQEYKFTFTNVGTWGFHNHLSPGETGTVIVE